MTACSVPGCGEPARARGWCSGHYNRWLRYGDPLAAPPRGRLKITGQERAEFIADLARRYEAGESTPQLAAATGWAKAAVQRLLQEAGVTMRPRAVPQASEQEAASLVARYRAYESIQEIADSIGRSDTFVRATLRRNGVTVRYRAAEPSIRRNFTHENRIAWNVLHPGEPNPFTCVVPGCTALADPTNDYLCAKHAARRRLTGTFSRPPCLRCGQELDMMGPYLCQGCYRAWRYCSDPRHIGHRILPVALMSSTTTKCKLCKGHARSAKCERCGGWATTRKIHSTKRRTICPDCWEGVPGCADRSGECSQPASRLIAGRCQAHYHRLHRAAGLPGRTRRLAVWASLR